ncbi:MAG: elongation factor P maturation arginine rhamnosyltransferase EarP, partial [Treponemataceae bacterium]|nr:elongation factor P maturation arginine rhamnosyltransferase EarP [Treponemataceae bacterium]
MNETMPKNSDITILCKVVDNFGDIGFVYRLAKNLQKINPRYKIRLVVNDLNSFQKIAPKIKLNSAEQNFCGMKIFDSSAEEICKAEFSKNLPRVILECFQCGRPNWLDEILFAPQSQEKICDKKSGENFLKNESIHIGANAEKIFQIINIDYLTAEDYAEEFHCLKSATRSAFVKKVNFMPGFTAKTGGLILDEFFIANWRAHFEKKCENFACDKNVAMQKSSSAKFSAHARAALSQKILIFSYQKNFSPIIRAFQKICDKNLSQIQIFLAQGIGKENFLETYRKFCDSQKFDLSQIQLNELGFL